MTLTLAAVLVVQDDLGPDVDQCLMPCIFGRSDLGVNRARIERWLGKLRQSLPLAR
mgnify:CR=1 FL=1